MSEQTRTQPIILEKRDSTAIVRPQVKMMDDDQLKKLIGVIDEAAGADSGVKLVILDLSRITILPSLALGLMVQISRNCKARDQKLKLAAVQVHIRKVFSVTRLDRVFQFADSVEMAME
jgi:anti-anti-sigma factor